MNTISTHFTKFQVGAAACAVAAAATLTPAVIAEARPDLVPITPVSELIGSPSLSPVNADGPWWWVGSSPNKAANASSLAPLAVTGETIFEFSPLALVPGFLQPIAKAVLGLIPQFSICLAGLGVKVGPYGTVKVTRGSC